MTKKIKIKKCQIDRFDVAQGVGLRLRENKAPAGQCCTIGTEHSYPYSHNHFPSLSQPHTLHLIHLHCTLTLNWTCHLLFGPLMAVYSSRAIRVQDMLLEIKEDLESRASSCRGKHPAEVNLLQKHTWSTLTAWMDCFWVNLCFHHFHGYFRYDHKEMMACTLFWESIQDTWYKSIAFLCYHTVKKDLIFWLQ